MARGVTAGMRCCGTIAAVTATTTTTATPLVSILICSYNYERFVGETIASALAQTWPGTEVIVVDDGSSDGSWGVIESFGDKVRAIRQPNGGQGAAYNTCFAASRGDWVIFLDCDDLLDADCVARCVEQMHDDVHKVAFCMRVIDAQSNATGNVIPYTMHAGDVRDTLRRFGIYGGPPGSGNFYRRSTAAPYFPLDEKVWPMCADTVPFVVAGAAGRVAAISEPLGGYRIHRKANKALGLFGNVLGTLNETMLLDDKRRAEALKMVALLLPLRTDEPLLPPPTLVRTRVISWRVQRAAHPYADDSAGSLLRLVWRSVNAWPGYGMLDRITTLMWSVGMLWLPKAAVAWLVRINVSNEAKRRLRAMSSM